MASQGGLVHGKYRRKKNWRARVKDDLDYEHFLGYFATEEEAKGVEDRFRREVLGKEDAA